MIRRMIKQIAPLAVLAMGAGLSGCGFVDVTINEEEGVPLAELDMDGASPKELVVAANATVILTPGDTLDISVEDDPEGALRFALDSETLGISVDPDLRIRNGKAVVRVTMPAPESIVIAGSGSVEAAQVATQSDLTIGGSGSINVAEIAAETLDVTIGGSGSIKGAGTADRLEISIGGSGDVDMPDLKADAAEISIGGSGSVEFASDGDVDASIAGAGNVRVYGSATCSVSAVGSGKLTCGPAAGEPEPADAAEDTAADSAEGATEVVEEEETPEE